MRLPDIHSSNHVSVFSISPSLSLILAYTIFFSSNQYLYFSQFVCLLYSSLLLIPCPFSFFSFPTSFFSFPSLFFFSTSSSPLPLYPYPFSFIFSVPLFPYLASQTYEVTVGDNPWWAIYSQQCPTCKQTQVGTILRPNLFYSTPS